MKDDVKFDWSYLGDIEAGRENLGEEMPVFVYRLLEYTMQEVLSKRYGKETSIELFREAGRAAGTYLYQRYLPDITDVSEFAAELKKTLAVFKIGILRFEDLREDGTMTLTISEDLDCSGLPVMGETVCHYDEGFIAGILTEFYQKEYVVKEIDCWAKGDRVCRFEAYVKKG